jgi:hypothetical protein
MTLKIFEFGSKGNFETLTGRNISEEQWTEIINEVNGRVENFLDGMFNDLVDDCKQDVGIFNSDIQNYIKSVHE